MTTTSRDATPDEQTRSPYRPVGVESYWVQGVHVLRHTTPGATQPVIMVHGGNHAGWAWSEYAGHFAAHGFDVHVLDWYNHGASDNTPDFLGRGIQAVACEEIAFVARAAAVSSTLDVKRPILIGHSMGALASLLYATMNEVRALVMLAPTPPMQLKAQVIGARVNFTQPFPPPSFAIARDMFWQDLTTEEARELYDLLEVESPRAVWEATRHTIYANFAALDGNGPRLVLAAEDDTLYPPETANQLAELAAAEYDTVPNVGHSDMLTRPGYWQAGADKIIKWLGDR